MKAVPVKGNPFEKKTVPPISNPSVESKLMSEMAMAKERMLAKLIAEYEKVEAQVNEAKESVSTNQKTIESLNKEIAKLEKEREKKYNDTIAATGGENFAQVLATTKETVNALRASTDQIYQTLSNTIKNQNEMILRQTDLMSLNKDIIVQIQSMKSDREIDFTPLIDSMKPVVVEQGSNGPREWEFTVERDHRDLLTGIRAKAIYD